MDSIEQTEPIGSLGGKGTPPTSPVNGDPAPEPQSPSAPTPIDELECRRRVEAAEAEAGALRARVADLERLVADGERRLAESRDEASRSERRRETESLLRERSAHDIETALLLADALLDAGESDCPRSAVDTLARRKPFLFEPTEAANGLSAMSASAHLPGGDDLEHLAEEARQSGDRRELLRYLRRRRGAS